MALEPLDPFRGQACDTIMVALAKLVEHRDNDTGLHRDRVTRYCRLLAEELAGHQRFRGQIDSDFLHDLTRAEPLHDIGKVAIPDYILLFPGKLSEQQMDIMRTHATIGAQTILSLIERMPEVHFLRMAADIASTITSGTMERVIPRVCPATRSHCRRGLPPWPTSTTR